MAAISVQEAGEGWWRVVDGDLQVLVRVQERAEGIVPVELAFGRVDEAPIVPRDVQRLPLGRIVSAVVAHAGRESVGGVRLPSKFGPRHARPGEDWWQSFAAACRAIGARGESIAAGVHRRYRGAVPIGTIYSWIHEARARGLLDPPVRRR